ncbi:MAG: hypothetical protein C4344_04905 [Acidimicrobiia bacterium]
MEVGWSDPAYRLFDPQDPQRMEPPAPEEGLWGSISIRATAREPLHIGSGAWLVVGDGPQAHAVSATVTTPTIRAGAIRHEPCIPGSSLKGALRVVVEVMSPSCDPFENRCKGSGPLCPACIIFGTAARRGLLAPGELTVTGEFTTEELRVAQRYSHANAPRRGWRLYRLEPESPLPSATEHLEVVARGTAFVGELGLRGIPDWGAGLVTIAAGLGPEGLPLLRIGGGKNRGLGILELELIALRSTRGIPVVPAPPDPAPLTTLREWQDHAAARFPHLLERRNAIAALYS